MRKKKGAFGVVYQDVTRSKNISLAAKGLYAYLSAYCGKDDKCYPSIDTILRETGITRDTFYKHINALVAAGVVEKRQVKNNNRFGRTIYKLTHEVEITSISDTENKDTTFSTPAEKHTNNNNINNNNINNNRINNICASVPDDTAKANRKKEANELFEQLWKAYPSKKGKAQVSDTAKARLLKIGYDEMMRAIDRYTYELKKDSDWRKPQNGSTFFNSGYVDYLDANYKSAEDAQKESDYEKAKELERRCWGDIKPIEGDDLPFQ